jgi:hypothetical protein
MKHGQIITVETVEIESRFKKIMKTKMRCCDLVLSFFVSIFLIFNECVVRGQETILYKHDSIEKPYLLSRHRLLNATTDVSEVINAKTCSASSVGGQVQLTFSNAIMFTTEITRDSSSKSVSNVRQETASAGSLTISFDKKEKIIYKEGVFEMGNLKIETPKIQNEAPQLHLEGKEAEQYLITNGIGLPPNMRAP